MSALFTIPIASDGAIHSTALTSNVYEIKIISPPDNRVATPMLSALLLTLDILEHKYPAGVIIITSGCEKFFSNGFDLEHVSSTPNFFHDIFYPVLHRLLSYPMPVIALLNGHSFGAGVFLAMACDYRIQNEKRGYLCLPEVDLGLIIPTAIAIMIKTKISSISNYQTAVFEGRRFRGAEARSLGLVDALGDTAEALSFIADRHLVQKAQSGVLGALKEDTYRDVLIAIDQVPELEAWRDAIEQRKSVQQEKSQKEVHAWERANKL